jgi:SAGA-associated factor 73
MESTDIEASPPPSKQKASKQSTPLSVEVDPKIRESFATGRPTEDQPEVKICKHCKKAISKSAAEAHINNCLKEKAEKAKQRKQRKEAKEAAQREKEEGIKPKEKDTDKEKDGDEITVKSADAADKADDSTKKGKKRKADGESEKTPKSKKKKDEPKPKAAKPKGPVDVERQCGVLLPNGAQCARSLTCKSHSMGAKRAVPGRSLPYDMLLHAYQKKNQARIQRAQIDSNAPLIDNDEAADGAVDSDEEKDAVMAGIARSNPQPMETKVWVDTKKKYESIRMKEMLAGALGLTRGPHGRYNQLAQAGLSSGMEDVGDNMGGQGGPSLMAQALSGQVPYWQDSPGPYRPTARQGSISAQPNE